MVAARAWVRIGGVGLLGTGRGMFILGFLCVRLAVWWRKERKQEGKWGRKGYVHARVARIGGTGKGDVCLFALTQNQREASEERERETHGRIFGPFQTDRANSARVGIILFSLSFECVALLLLLLLLLHLHDSAICLCYVHSTTPNHTTPRIVPRVKFQLLPMVERCRHSGC